MEAAFPRRSTFRFPWVLLIVVLTAVAVAYGAHAVLRHGNAALLARECLEQRGPVATLNNPVTHRTAQVCALDDGKYAIVVTEGETEITSFVKDKMKRLDQVIQYLKNVGYQ